MNTWGVAIGKVVNLIDGVDTEEFRPHLQSEARRALGIPDNIKVVVYLGLLNQYQGIDLLFDVIALVKAESQDVRFLLMGFPDAEYRVKACEMGIADVIIFTGRVDYARAPLFLSAGDLAVSPKLSLTEANGKLFNYMACGLPTVVFDDQMNREIFGEDGDYVEYGNADLFAKTISSTIHDDAMLASLSLRVRKGRIRCIPGVQDHCYSMQSIKNYWHPRAAQIDEKYTLSVKIILTRNFRFAI